MASVDRRADGSPDAKKLPPPIDSKRIKSAQPAFSKGKKRQGKRMGSGG